MDVVVTGADGFIGKNLCERLSHRPDVQIVKKIDKKSGHDVLETRFPQCDVIVHLAAQVSSINSVTDPLMDFRNNAIATVQVLQEARRIGARVVYTSSCKVYPSENGGRTPYGASKYVGDLYCEEYNATYGVPVTINRCSTIYGPGQDGSAESGWLTWFVKAAKHDIPLTIFGDGNQGRDPVWISDVIDLLVMQITQPELFTQRVYDVGSGIQGHVTLMEVIELLAELKGSPVRYEYADRRPSDLEHFIANLLPLEGIWKPTVLPKEGLAILWNLPSDSSPSLETLLA